MMPLCSDATTQTALATEPKLFLSSTILTLSRVIPQVDSLSQSKVGASTVQTSPLRSMGKTAQFKVMVKTPSSA